MFNDTDWVRGNSQPPHPIEFVDTTVMPSPPRGEGTATAAGILGSTALSTQR
jgi:hypothetical protein